MNFPLKTLESLSSVFGYFTSRSRDAINGLWLGYHLSIEELRKKASRFTGAQSCVDRDADDSVALSIQTGPLNSIPLYLDPLAKVFNFKPVLIHEFDTVDHVCVAENVWKQIYGYFSHTTTIAASDQAKIPQTFAETPQNIAGAFYAVCGEYAAATVGIWRMKVGDYIEYYISIVPGIVFGDQPTMYMTTGMSYMVGESILSVPTIRSRTTDEGTVSDSNDYYTEGVDYRFWRNGHVVEFYPDKVRRLTGWPVLFSTDATTVNTELYQTRGSTVDMGSYDKLMLDNASAAAAIYAAEASVLESGDLDRYAQSLASVYRMPVADRTYSVIGQFEAVGYRLEYTNSRWAMITKAAVPYTGKALVGNTVYQFENGSTETVSDLSGMTAHPLIIGRYVLKSRSYSDGDSVQIVQFTDPEGTLVGKVDSILDVCLLVYGGKVLPSAVLETNDDGKKCVVHFVPQSVGTGAMTMSAGTDSILTTYKYDSSAEDVPLYHDPEFPAPSTSDSEHPVGTMIFMNPDHKMLVLYDGSTYVRFYMDSPVYSRLNPGDTVYAGDILCESMIVGPSDLYPSIRHSDICRHSDKSRHANSILEIVQVTQIAGYGADFPDSVVEIG